MEFTTLKKNLDLVANLFARDIFPECMVSRRLLWQILFSYQCFVNDVTISITKYQASQRSFQRFT